MKQVILGCVTSVILTLIIVFGIGRIVGHNKQADLIESQVDQKMLWMININTAMNGVRNVNLSIRQQCANGKTPSALQQNILRSHAREALIGASSGSGIIFDGNTLNDIRAFIQFDINVEDVCALPVKSDDAAWRDLASKVNKDMDASIGTDKANIAKLHGVTIS
ncbi:MAG: hypothetical protein K2Q14_06070 [Gammaproteobacteria bacterium]|nr:hypothetical protein [Gammaproteobacteria bacterium]